MEFKICTCCKRSLPATTAFFARRSAKEEVLRTQCKECRNKLRNERRHKLKENPDYKTYYDNNKLKMLVGNMNFRANGDMSYVDVKNMLDSLRNENGNIHCTYCNREIIEDKDDKMLQLDHFIAVKLGGINCVENIVPACKYCNRSKWDEDIIEWYKDQLFYNPEKEKEFLKRYDYIYNLMTQINVVNF